MNEAQVRALFGQIGEILDRVTRIETRIVRVMNHLGLDTHGRKVDPTDKS